MARFGTNLPEVSLYEHAARQGVELVPLTPEFDCATGDSVEDDVMSRMLVRSLFDSLEATTIADSTIEMTEQYLLDGLAYTEIAATHGLTLGAVSQMIRRAIGKMNNAGRETGLLQ